jgi:hypothetical protein
MEIDHYGELVSCIGSHSSIALAVREVRYNPLVVLLPLIWFARRRQNLSPYGRPMGRFSNTELRKFRGTSHCSACVHYSGCQLWLALLLMNDELGASGLDIIIPDLTIPCSMFFPWTTESARRFNPQSRIFNPELPSR